MAAISPKTDERTKAEDVITEHKENGNSLTDSPEESVIHPPEHVTAKTWLVIFVCGRTSAPYAHPVLTLMADIVLNIRLVVLACADYWCDASWNSCQIRGSNCCILDGYDRS